MNSWDTPTENAKDNLTETWFINTAHGKRTLYEKQKEWNKNQSHQSKQTE